MSRTKKIFRNSAILTAQHILINVIAIVVIGYIARKLGHKDYGIYSLAFSFPAIFEIIGHLGLRTLTVRETSRLRNDSFDYLGKIIPARIIFIGVMGITVVLSALLMNYDERVIIAILIALGASVFDQMSRIILDVFQAFEELGMVAIRDVIVRLFTAISCVLVLLSGYGLYQICLVYMVGSLLGLIINTVLYLRRFPLPNFKYDVPFIVSNLKEGSSFIVIGLAAVIFTKSDVVILSKLTDNASVGLYNASANLFNRMNILSDSISMALFPAISELYWTNVNEANSIYNKSLLVILIIALPVGIGGAILSDQIIFLIYGKTYSESINIFTILMLSIPSMFIGTLLFYILGAIKQQVFVAKVLVFNAVVNIIANIVLIYYYGAKGAAIATLITHTVSSLLLFYGITKYFKLNIKFRSYFAVLISLTFMACVAYLSKPLGIFIAVPGAALVYFITMTIIGGEDMSFSNLKKLR